jgi:hypothetical protein
MTPKITICSNHEVLNVPVDDVIELVRIAGKVAYCHSPSLEIEQDNFFRNWSGGKYDQFWKRCGFVAIQKEYAGTSLEDIAWEMNDAMQAKMEECV